MEHPFSWSRSELRTFQPPARSQGATEVVQALLSKSQDTGGDHPKPTEH